MDDADNDAMYPPNHNHPNNFNRFPSSSSRPNNPFNRFPIAPHDEDSDEDDDDESLDRPENEDVEEEDEENHTGRSYERESSEESRGKRRKLDQFEFAPRALPTFSIAAPVQPKPFVRNPLVDWTEDETFLLLEAWGDRFVQNGRKSLRSEEWNEVARRVCQGSRIPRTESQCRNRVDTLKKKYKKEKAKMLENVNVASNWIYFKKMDALMSVPPPPKPVVPQQMYQYQHQPPQQLPLPPRLVPCGVDAGEYGFTNSRIYTRLNDNDGLRNSPGDVGSEDDGDDDNEDDSDGLPPRRENVSRSSDSSFRMLAYSIQKFGEVYEKIEYNNRQQMAELERMRKEFQRDLEVRQRQILERAQAEIARLREEEDEEDDGEDNDDDDDGDDDDNGGSAENLSGFLAGSVYLTVFA